MNTWGKGANKATRCTLTCCMGVSLYVPAPVDAKDINGYTPMQLAAGNGHMEVVKALLAGGEGEERGGWGQRFVWLCDSVWVPLVGVCRR